MSRAPWQDKYLIEVFREDGGSSIYGTILSTADFGSGSLGVGPGKYLLPVIGHPSVVDPLPVSGRRLADGKSAEPELSGTAVAPERTPTAVSFVLEFEATPALIGLFSHLLFQGGFEDDGSEGGASSYAKSMVPYTSPTPVVWANVGRQMTSAGAYELSHGLLCRRMSLVGSEQTGYWHLSAEMFGRGTAVGTSLPSALQVSHEDAVLLFKNTTMTYAGSTIRTDYVSLTFVNNAGGHYYAGRQMDRMTLGPLDAQLDWAVPYEGNSVLSSRGTASAAAVTLAVSAGSLSFGLSGKVEPRVVDVEVRGAELDCAVGGRMLHSTGSPITFTVSDGVQRLI